MKQLLLTLKGSARKKSSCFALTALKEDAGQHPSTTSFLNRNYTWKVNTVK